MLDEKTRVIMFWFTVGMMIVVVAVALLSLVRACTRGGAELAPLFISPEEVSLCQGDRSQFRVEGVLEDGAEIEWRTSGGSITGSGPLAAEFVADDKPDDYVITVIQRKPRQMADAVVHVHACTPTPISSPTPIPTITPIPSPTPTSTPVPTPMPSDVQGDVRAYEGGAAVEGVPAGVDIRSASVRPDLRLTVDSTGGLPEELTGWPGQGEVAFWILLYEPIPNPPAYTDWLFALDLDGDVATGRPAGSARVNPDLGDDAVVGVLYDPAVGDFDPYFLVWDPAQESWVDGPAGIRFQMAESRTVIGLAVSLETLTQAVAEAAGTSVVPGAARGRVAVLSFAAEQAVVDFYPDRPE